jgi:hypothetical protein
MRLLPLLAAMVCLVGLVPTAEAVAGNPFPRCGEPEEAPVGYATCACSEVVRGISPGLRCAPPL